MHLTGAPMKHNYVGDKGQVLNQGDQDFDELMIVILEYRKPFL